MEHQLNQVIWIGVYSFVLPCLERSVMATKWVSENTSDMEQFKKHFPDAISTCGLLPMSGELHISICSPKCPLHETCDLPQVYDRSALSLLFEKFRSTF